METPLVAPPVVKIGPWEGLAGRLIATGARFCALVSLVAGKITGVAFLATQPRERRLKNVMYRSNFIYIYSGFFFLCLTR